MNLFGNEPVSLFLYVFSWGFGGFFFGILWVCLGALDLWEREYVCGCVTRDCFVVLPFAAAAKKRKRYSWATRSRNGLRP